MSSATFFLVPGRRLPLCRIASNLFVSFASITIDSFLIRPNPLAINQERPTPKRRTLFS